MTDLATSTFIFGLASRDAALYDWNRLGLFTGLRLA
jgi:hypothetical protein